MLELSVFYHGCEYGFELFRAKQIRSGGGSIRLYLARPKVQPIHPSVDEFREREKARGSVIDQLKLFARQVEKAKGLLISHIQQICLNTDAPTCH